MSYHLLRRQGSDAEKQSLLAALRADKPPPSRFERVGLWFERVWPQVRIPAYAGGFAVALAGVTALGVIYTQAPIAAPEIDDMEFGGSAAVIVESTTDPATLIWLADDEEQDEETDDQEDQEF